MDLNKVQLIWNITSDPEIKTVPSGNKVANFSIATNRKWTDANGNKQEEAEFHNITLWSKLADIAEKYLKKGMKVYIEWRLSTQSWEAQDWTKRYKTVIIGENIIMLGWKSNDTDTTSTAKTDNNTNTSKTNTEEEDISVDQIPF